LCNQFGADAVLGLRRACIAIMFNGATPSAELLQQFCLATFSCNRRQDDIVDAEVDIGAAQVNTLTQQAKSGMVEGVPPTAEVTVTDPATGAVVPVVPPSPVAANTFIRVISATNTVECPEPTTFDAKLASSGYTVPAGVVSTVQCTAARVQAKVTVILSPGSGVDVAAATQAIATALQSCVTTLDANGNVIIPNVCPPPSVPVVPSPGAPVVAGKNSRKGLLGLLGLLGLIPLLICLALLCCCLIRRRKRGTEMVYAVYEMDSVAPCPAGPAFPVTHSEEMLP